MFHSCNSVKVLDLSSFDITNIVSGYNMISSCYKLQRLDISGFHFSGKINLFSSIYPEKPLVLIVNKDIEENVKEQVKDDWIVIVK